MKLVVGRISDHGSVRDEHWQRIRRAQVNVAVSDKQGAW